MKRIALLTICAALALISARAQTGDAAAGERLFAGKGNCATCHMVRGRGSVLGPDLSDIGRDRTAAQIEQALRDPGGAGSYPAVTVRLRTGRTIHGIAKNESTFDLQVLDMEEKLYLLSKDQGRIQRLSPNGAPRPSSIHRATAMHPVGPGPREVAMRYSSSSGRAASICARAWSITLRVWFVSDLALTIAGSIASFAR
jgi:putative heme-binding domain-containing protein